jgi:hypothetical protein
MPSASATSAARSASSLAKSPPHAAPLGWLVSECQAPGVGKVDELAVFDVGGVFRKDHVYQ